MFIMHVVGVKVRAETIKLELDENVQKLNTYKDFLPLCLHLECSNWISVVWSIYEVRRENNLI